MDHFNQNHRTEICIVLVAEETEFVVERAIINELICPTLRRYFMTEFQIEFNIVDVYQNNNCNNVPIIDKSDLVLSELKRAQKESSGLSSVILLGDQCGKLQAPKTLTSLQFNHVLNFLQTNKDPSWKTFNSKYSKSKTSQDYLLVDKVTEEDADFILSNIDLSISSKSSDIFPTSFISEYLTLGIDKFVSIATIDRKAISNTYIIRRNVSNSYASDRQTNPETVFQMKLKEKYDTIIKTTRRKCLPNNFIEYTINNIALLEAQRDVLNKKSKLSDIGEAWNFLSGKVRSLAKDIRVSSSSDFYLQVFLEHVTKIIRETSIYNLMKKDVSVDKSLKETISHILPNNRINNEELTVTLNRNREREMGIFENYFNSGSAKMPGLIFGLIGSGKTTLILDLVSKIEKKANMIMIIRHCGKTVSSSNLQLLICSMSDQINSSVLKRSVANNACEYAVCVYDFWTSLNKASSSRPIIVFLDDVESLFPSGHTDMVKWLPPTLPNNVKVILTSSSESFYQGFKKRYDASNIINLTKMDPKEGIRLLPALCKNCSILETVLNQANFCLQENSTPLFLHVLAQCLEFVKNPEDISFDTKSVFKIYLGQLQSNYNSIIIKHILCYLALSRFGLSVSELNDLLSLDNRMLMLLEFNVNAKATFTFPIYLTLYYLNKCHTFLTQIQTNGKILIRIKHGTFVQSITEQFQLLQEERDFFYQILYDYWTSKFSGNKLKPTFDRVSNEDDNLSVVESHLYVKRGVSAQPYYTILKDREIVSNQRKLVELPGMLIKFEKVQELYKLVVFNFEYLFATLHCYGINHLISELYYTRQVHEIKNNCELELLLAQLRLLSSEVIEDARLLAPELTGRLCHLIGANSFLSQLHHQIDNGGTKINALFAAIPCYPTIDIENIRVDIGVNKELMFSSLSPDNRFLSTFIKDATTKDFFVFIWDTKSATKSQIINLGKFPNTKFHTMFYMPQSDEFLLLQFVDAISCGFLIVNLEFSNIENTIKFPKNTSLTIEHLSKSHLYLNVNGDNQIYTHPTGKLDIGVTRMPWPTQMTPNDRYLIGPRPITKKSSDTNKGGFNLRVMNAATGEVVCQLSLNMATFCMFANVRNEILFVGTKSHGIALRFDISQIAKKDAKSLKSNLELKLNEQVALGDDIKECIAKFYPNIRVTKFLLSVDERFLIVEYVFNDSLRAFALWNIVSKTVLRCQMVEISATVAFSVDGLYLYYHQRHGTLNIFNLQTNTDYNLMLRDIPEQIYMLRSGSLIMSLTKSIKLTTLKDLLQDYGNQNNSQTFQQETFCTALRKPKISNENIVIFSNYEETSTFLYFKLINNSIMSVDISHTNESLTEYSTDRFLSPDGEKLLLVFGFKLANLMVTDQEYDIDSLTIHPRSNGQIINDLNDYRKPQIPKENYFTGKDSTKPNKVRSAYCQKIVKVIDLRTLKMFFQVSLCGEEILKFTDSQLLTFKRDHASATRTCADAYDIVSIYDITGARHITSIHLEHPVVDATLVPSDKDKMLVCCGNGGKLLKLLGGENFCTVLFEIDVQILLRRYDELARISCVTRMFIFADINDSVLLQFSWFDNTGAIKIEKDTFYTKIDIVKKEIHCQFTTPGKVTDVSCDGSLAIDSLLNLFDLHKGSLQRNLQGSIYRPLDATTYNYTSLFSRDGNHIAVLDSSSNILWIVKNDDQYLMVGKTLLTSSFEDDISASSFTMELALGGQLVLVYNEREFKIFVVKISQKSMPYDCNYKSNIERIKKILLP